MISFTPPLTLHSSKRRKHVGKSKCDFLIKGESVCDENPSYSVLMQLSILSKTSGIRLEFLRLPLAFYPQPRNMIDVQLTPPHFSSPIPLFLNKRSMTVNQWNCHSCWIESDDNNNGDKNSMVDLRLYLSDGEEPAQITVSFHPLQMEPMFTPHVKTPVRVQNMCGSCVTPYQLNLACFQHISKTKILKRSFSACESLSTVTGNFVLCSNRSRVDFRGVRSITSMTPDWKLISGLNIENVSTTIYMIVLKGCIGKALFFDSSCCCYLANQTAGWCKGILHFGDVCDVIELRDIKWNLIPHIGDYGFKIASKTTLLAKTSIHVSRRGGAVIRLVFSPPMPWNVSLEEDVIRDCNMLMNIIGEILKGKIPTSQSIISPTTAT